MERRSSPTEKSPTAALTVLALIGPIFGVATQVWGQALLLLGLGVLLIVSPPRRSPGAAWCAIFLAILAIAFTAFLPARWFGIPEWRKTLVEDYRVELPGTLSPQPWLSLHAAILLFAGIVFALYLTTRLWSSHSRRQAARWYTGGIALLAVLALASLSAGWHVPIWPKVLNSLTGFGIFPNRNQTGNLFALAGIMATALAFDGFAKGRKSALVWSAAVLVLGAAIVQTYSRAGVLLFFGGIAAYGLLSFSLSSSAKGGSLTIAGFALLLTGFFVFGGGSFERFQKLTRDSAPDFRVVVQKDALHLVGAAPWLGQGLGNFEPVFAMARAASADQNRALHPESDWLWIAVEMGWPAAVLLAAAFALWIRQCLPLASGTDRTMRTAAMVCGVAFAVHSFVDVSGHRPGTVWPALFLAGLAMHPSRELIRVRWVAPVFRTLGVILAVISGWWLASVFSERVGRTAPTMATEMMLENRTVEQNLQSRHAEAVVSANGALRISPLNADLYYQRGIARVVEAFSIWGTAKDFATARFLEPHWAELCLAQGKAWTEAGQPEFAYEVWVEALRRAGKNGPDYYYKMLAWSRGRPASSVTLARLSHNDPNYFLVYLEQADRLEVGLQIDQLVQAEPDLKSFSSGQRRTLFSIWFRYGDHRLLLSKLLANPEWKKEGWRWLAVLYAEGKRFQDACELMRDSMPRPVMPKILGSKPLAELERMFRARPDDIDIGLQLHTAQLSVGKRQEALETLRILQALPNHPIYLSFIEAGQFEESEDWENAWKAWLQFGAAEFR